MTVKVKPKIPKGAINSLETIKDKIRNEYVIFSGLTINTRGYFTICVSFSKKNWTNCELVLNVKPIIQGYIIVLLFNLPVFSKTSYRPI